jgi:putative DNA primase/helicase
MDFITFCRLHGLLIDYLPPIGVWKRYPTEDHPRKRNGAAKYMGTHGFVQNHAIETEVSVWKSDDPRLDVARIQRDASAARRRMIQDQQAAADKAAWIVSRCTHNTHPYLEARGFPKETGLVWHTDGTQLLVIPMRDAGHLVGCQLIDPDGTKRFLKGQRTAGASFCINNHGPIILVEGYATGLAVQHAMRQLRRPYTLHVCFSAGNLTAIAKRFRDGLVIADNDKSGTGEAAAKATGWSYWMSDQVGEDANDTYRRLGAFRFSQSLLKVIARAVATSPAARPGPSFATRG